MKCMLLKTRTLFFGFPCRGLTFVGDSFVAADPLIGIGCTWALDSANLLCACIGRAIPRPPKIPNDPLAHGQSASSTLQCLSIMAFIISSLSAGLRNGLAIAQGGMGLQSGGVRDARPNHRFKIALICAQLTAFDQLVKEFVGRFRQRTIIDAGASRLFKIISLPGISDISRHNFARERFVGQRARQPDQPFGKRSAWNRKLIPKARLQRFRHLEKVGVVPRNNVSTFSLINVGRSQMRVCQIANIDSTYAKIRYTAFNRPSPN